MRLVRPHSRSGRRLIAAWLALAWAVAMTRAGPGENLTPAPDEVKAVWLLNFARHFDWPGEAFARPNAPIVVAVVGHDPFGARLEAAFTDKVVKGHNLLVRRLAPDQSLGRCHIVFVSPSERKRYRELTDQLRGQPVLTVGDSSEFLEQGGMVEFVRKDDTIRFKINLEPARRARLRASANLLKVAVSVQGTYE